MRVDVTMQPRLCTYLPYAALHSSQQRKRLHHPLSKLSSQELYLPHHLEFIIFFLNDPPPTEIYSFPLHDALPILQLWVTVTLKKTPHIFPPRITTGR